MSKAKTGDKVKVHYTGKFADGTVFDSSSDREPLEFKIGEGSVIPGFEKAIEGMKAGEKKTTTIPADLAYGQHIKEMVMEVARTEFPPEMKIEEGQTLQIGSNDDPKKTVVVIVKISDTKVILDGNHQLAGKDLTFDLELISVN